MKQNIENLIAYAIRHRVIEERDYTYIKNQLYALLNLERNYEAIKPGLIKYPSDALTVILDQMVAEGTVDNTVIARDLMDSKIMNVFAKLPSVVEREFAELKKIDIKQATTYLYNYGINTNYIRKDRTDKNIYFKGAAKYGFLEVTINVSKPEKDPQAIAAAAKALSTNYPLCVLCPENEGFRGNIRRDARHQHRLIKLNLLDETWYLQYSPYVYYDEHLIVLKREHEQMLINDKTFRRLLALVKMFPHYFFGSNADLPIVGGSLLSHEHYQGGKHVFAMEEAKVLYTKTKDHVAFSILNWPLATLRLRSDNVDKLVKYANNIFTAWQTYDNETLNLKSRTNNTPHHTVTPIARFKDGAYELDLILRSNFTTDKAPLGLYHPSSDKWHIKKENIGLIEAMGRAILPGRLLGELENIKAHLFENTPLSAEANKHLPWIKSFQEELTRDNYDAKIKQALITKFAAILEDCHVFKHDLSGNAFGLFLEGVLNRDE